MKRWSLPASALVLVLIACGAGVKPAPQVAEARARVPSVHAVAARREHAATREAKRLLRRFVVPAGAQPIPQPRGHAGVLRRSGPEPLDGETADVHRFWSVHEPLETVIAFLRAHRLHGFGHSTASWGSRKPHYLSMSSRAATGDRYLNVTSVGLPARTMIRADVEVEWTYPRSPRERIPAATSEIDVRAPNVSVVVKSPAKIARVRRWFDALPVAPPGIVVSCPLALAPSITLSFRGAGGARLAHADVPPAPAWICSSIEFTIGGEHQEPLIDRPGHPSFVRRLQQLLGVHLVRVRR